MTVSLAFLNSQQRALNFVSCFSVELQRAPGFQMHHSFFFKSNTTLWLRLLLLASVYTCLSGESMESAPGIRDRLFLMGEGALGI